VAKPSFWPEIKRVYSSKDTQRCQYNRHQDHNFRLDNMSSNCFRSYCNAKASGRGRGIKRRTDSIKPGLNMTLSSQSTTSLEEVMIAAKSQAARGVLSPKFWFQIYMTPDMNHNIALIKRAEGTVPMTVEKIKLGGC